MVHLATWPFQLYSQPPPQNVVAVLSMQLTVVVVFCWLLHNELLTLCIIDV